MSNHLHSVFGSTALDRPRRRTRPGPSGRLRSSLLRSGRLCPGRIRIGRIRIGRLRPDHPLALVFATALAFGAAACGPVAGNPADGPPTGAESELVTAPEDSAAVASSPDEDTGTAGSSAASGSSAPAGAASDASAGAAPNAPAISSDGGFDGQFTELNWDELYELDLETGEPSPLLAGLDGQPVKIPGFMVPLDDSATSVSEFLLVPFAGACIHVPPPPPNQIVHVTMVDGSSSEVYWWDPIWIFGDLEIENVEHAYGQASFKMSGLRTEVYTAQPASP